MEQRASIRTRWAPTELAVAGLLVAFGFVILGGLAIGIALAATQQGGPAFSETLAIGGYLQFGAEWAVPLFAAVLLAVLGTCAWQASAWWEAAERDTTDDREITDHIVRWGTLALGAEGELVLTTIGSVAFFVGAVLANRGLGAATNQWVRDIPSAASLLAILTLTTVGTLIARATNAKARSYQTSQ